MHFHTRLQAIAAGGVGLYLSSWADHSHINTVPKYQTNHILPSAAVGVPPSIHCYLMNRGGEHMDKSSLSFQTLFQHESEEGELILKCDQL